MTADPRAEFAPPIQPLAPVFETLARLGDRESARDFAARWHELRGKYFGAESLPTQRAAKLQQRLATIAATPVDLARAERLRKALAAYWDATFDKYDSTQDYRSLSLDRDL